jgi:ribosomal-protein-alanine acetyltransferase
LAKFDIHIRSACRADTSHIFGLERQAQTAAHWPKSFYLGLFENAGASRVSLVAEIEAAIHGFLLARLVGDECELENIVVAPATQRCGVGSNLIRAFIKTVRDRNATRVFLEVRESNRTARSFYESCGFSIAGRRQSYYRDPAEDAILYALAT